MISDSFTVLRYITPAGRQPYTEWERNLKDRIGAKLVRAHMHRMQFGHFGKSKRVDDLVWELKINFGPGYRL